MQVTSMVDECLDLAGGVVVRLGQQVVLLSPVAGALMVELELCGPSSTERLFDQLVQMFGDPGHGDAFQETVNQLSRAGLIGLVPGV